MGRGRRFFFGVCKILGSGIAKNENQAATVRRPCEVFHILNCFSELLSFAALAIEEPDLFLAFVAFGEEGEGFAVVAPARVLGGDAFGGHGEGVTARGGDHPDAGFGFVGFEAGFIDGVGDPLAVGAELRVVDGLDLEVVVYGDGARGGSLGRGGKRQAKRGDAEYTETERSGGWEELHADDSLAGMRACKIKGASLAQGTSVHGSSSEGSPYYGKGERSSSEG